MSEFQHFWCSTGRCSGDKWVIINLDKVSSIRYPDGDDDRFYVDMDGNMTFLFTRKELERLMSAMGRSGHKLFDNDGNRT